MKAAIRAGVPGVALFETSTDTSLNLKYGNDLLEWSQHLDESFGRLSSAALNEGIDMKLSEGRKACMIYAAAAAAIAASPYSLLGRGFAGAKPDRHDRTSGVDLGFTKFTFAGRQYRGVHAGIAAGANLGGQPDQVHSGPGKLGGGAQSMRQWLRRLPRHRVQHQRDLWPYRERPVAKQSE